MTSSHGTAQRVGLLLGMAGAVAAVTALGCSPTETAVYLQQSLTREVDATESYHVSVTVSRAALQESSAGIWIVAETSWPHEGTTIALVADDEALDPLITNRVGSSELLGHDLVDFCPTEGDCVVGLTVVVQSEGNAGTVVRATAGRSVDDGPFSDAATITIVAD